MWYRGVFRNVQLQYSPRLVSSQAVWELSCRSNEFAFFWGHLPQQCMLLVGRQAAKKERCSVSIILSKHVLLFTPESKSGGGRETRKCRSEWTFLLLGKQINKCQRAFRFWQPCGGVSAASFFPPAALSASLHPPLSPDWDTAQR